MKPKSPTPEAIEIYWVFLFNRILDPYDNIKQERFNPIGVTFTENYSESPHLYTTPIVFKLYTSQTVLIHPTKKFKIVPKLF